MFFGSFEEGDGTKTCARPVQERGADQEKNQEIDQPQGWSGPPPKSTAVACAQGQVGHTGGEPLVRQARVAVAGDCAGTERTAGAEGATRPIGPRAPKLVG